MAKQNITAPSYAVNNVQQLANIVQGDASALKTTFDKTGSDTKDYISNTLISELSGPNGANKIGLSNPNLGSDNVADGVEEIREIAVQAQGGTILPNSIDNTKLGSDVKVGSLATLTTTNKNSVTEAINEVDANVDTAQSTATSAQNKANTVETNLNILRVAKTSTGSAVAYVLDTDGTFDLTVTGNRVMFIPNTANSGACTIALDGQTAKSIKKANDSGTYVDVVAGDIKQGVPTELVWSVGNGFFILRPSSGASIRSAQYGSFDFPSGQTTYDVIVTPVNTAIAIQKVTLAGGGNNSAYNAIDCELLNSTTLRFTRNASSTSNIVRWSLVEWNGVKSKQIGIAVPTDFAYNINVTSINYMKSIIEMSFKGTSTVATNMAISYLLTNTQIQTYTADSYTNRLYRYTILEFN